MNDEDAAFIAAVMRHLEAEYFDERGINPPRCARRLMRKRAEKMLITAKAVQRAAVRSV